MEIGKRCRSASIDKKIIEKSKTVSKCTCVGEKIKKGGRIKEGLPGKDKFGKSSLIPVLKGEKIDLKYIARKPKEPSEPLKLSRPCPCGKKSKYDDDFKLKLKILEEKEKSIAEYYLKIEETLRKIIIQKDQKEANEPVKDKNESQNSGARKMSSEPTVLSTGRTQNNILIDFEQNIEQISNIWLKTSSDLYKTLKNLKKNPCLDPMEFEVENARIKMAIKQAKSLTLMKTKSVIAEAKKLYNQGEMIRLELEKLLTPGNFKPANGLCSFSGGECQENEKVERISEAVNLDGREKKEADGTGDSSKDWDLEVVKESQNGEDNKKQKLINKSSHEKAEISDDSLEKQIKQIGFRHSPSEVMGGEMEIMAAELTKKNETITNLNSKIFELQKACNDHLYRYNELQNKLSEFQEKIQWNQVLWKHISKLKERILGLQHSNKQLEAHKRELEGKIMKLDKELERLIKLNHLLNRRKCALEAQECCEKDCRFREDESMEKDVDENTESKDKIEERVLSEKKNAIIQLKTILDTMKDQRNFAQKQIATFQLKIEALEKKSNI